jgi:hypothetical protein
MSDKWPQPRRPDHDHDHDGRPDHDGEREPEPARPPQPDAPESAAFEHRDAPDDFEVLLFGAAGPQLTLEQAELNTELLSALALAARTCGVVPAAVQLPAAPAAPGGSDAANDDRPPFDSAYCLRLRLRTREGHPRGRTDVLNAVLRLATLYRLGFYLGETSDPGGAGDQGAGNQGAGKQGTTTGPGAVRYRRVLALPAPRRPGAHAAPRHRVIDLTAAEPVPPRSPLDGSLMVTVVGPLRRDLADDLVRIATFLDDHRIGCHAVTTTVLVTEGTVVLNLVLAVLPGAPVGRRAFTEILRRGLGCDPVWPRGFRPTLLDPVATRS